MPNDEKQRDFEEDTDEVKMDANANANDDGGFDDLVIEVDESEVKAESEAPASSGKRFSEDD